MELLQLKYFCDAARTENFSRTAESFMVPASNISQSIKRLEKELGVVLFDHGKNRVTLAETGLRFYEKASAALALLEEAWNEAVAGGEPEGEIRLNILCNRRVVTEAIEKFKQDYPGVGFVLFHGQEAEGDFDMVITDKCPTGYTRHRLLVEENILLALCRSHPLAEREVITAEDLRHERFISMPKGRSLYDITVDYCGEADFFPSITIQTDDPYYVRKYVELGLGVALVPACSWQGLFSERAVLKDLGLYRRKTYICTAAKKGLSASAAMFLKYL